MMIPNFPQFSHLTLDDKQLYEDLVTDYPPFSDISFATLNIWWNLEGKLEICLLNNNLVIKYYQSFDLENSGLSLIGKNKVDESIQVLFNYLKQDSEAVRLVHVPEFVIKAINERDQFKIKEEVDYNEYILDSHALASLEHPSHGRTRRKVKRFLREVEDRQVEIRQIDLSTAETQENIFNSIKDWEQTQSSANDPDKTEHLALKKALKHSAELGIHNMGLYINDKLYGVFLYHHSFDNKYYIMNHLKVDYSIPYIFDYMTHHIANQASQENINFLNMEMDLGIENLRRHKMGLRPVDFFRKFTVSPAEI
jgi:hypothetical protein